MRLILHIGAGKTGTTSIQNTLLKNKESFELNGIKYLGMMLEETYQVKYTWQDKHKNYHQSIKDPKIEKELLIILRDTVKIAKKHNIHTLIWVNESILDNPHRILTALNMLGDDTVTIEVVMYVRNYLEWSQSAYLQWGIKHKTYAGNLQNFATFSNRYQPLFYSKLQNIIKNYNYPVFVRNMSATKDVVSDFLSYCNIEIKSINSIDDNSRPRQEELFFRAIFNSKFSDPVLPNEYDNIIATKMNINTTPNEYLEFLLPSNEDLMRVSESTQNDKNLINAVLHEQGQKQIESEQPTAKKVNLDLNILIKSLSEIVISQSIQLNNLEEEIKKLKRDNE